MPRSKVMDRRAAWGRTATAADLEGGGGFGDRAAFCRLGMLARQRSEARWLKLADAAVNDDAAGDCDGVLLSLRVDRSPCQQSDAGRLDESRRNCHPPRDTCQVETGPERRHRRTAAPSGCGASTRYQARPPRAKSLRIYPQTGSSRRRAPILTMGRQRPLSPTTAPGTTLRLVSEREQPPKNQSGG